MADILDLLKYILSPIMHRSGWPTTKYTGESKKNFEKTECLAFIHIRTKYVFITNQAIIIMIHILHTRVDFHSCPGLMMHTMNK